MSTQQDEEIDRIFKLLDDGLETQIFRKTRLTGVDVHSSLLSVIERRTSSSPSSSTVNQDDSIARMLYEDDPSLESLSTPRGGTNKYPPPPTP